jgi:hypothetical protein
VRQRSDQTEYGHGNLDSADLRQLLDRQTTQRLVRVRLRRRWLRRQRDDRCDERRKNNGDLNAARRGLNVSAARRGARAEE